MTLLPLLLACQDTNGCAHAPNLVFAPPGWTPVVEGATLDGGTARSVAAWDGGWVADMGSGLLRPGATEVEPSPAWPFLDAIGDGVLLGWRQGTGLLRSEDGGLSWAAPAAPPEQPLLALLNPRGQVFPRDTAVDGRGVVWLAALGGLYTSADQGDTWTPVDLSSTGRFNVLFTGVAVDGDRVAAVAQLADSLLPADLQGVFSGTVFLSEDGGVTWSVPGTELPGAAPMDVAFQHGRVVVATLGEGTQAWDGSAWTDLGGPVDAVGLMVSDQALRVASASRGLWALAEHTWYQRDVGPVADMERTLALGSGGALMMAEDFQVDAELAAPPAGGRVYVALSYHVNLYHSYRGDSPTDDGYGVDIDVIRTVLDHHDARPAFHADWDIENHFSLDGWLAEDAPDIVERIATRVAAGTDDVRLMSWNNGAMATHTREEFDQAILRAQASNEAAFGRVVAGVQPQECMFSPDHIGAYGDLGVDWVTLFYAANGFTALRRDTLLEGVQAFQAFSLNDPQTGRSIVAVPAWHHGDVLDHGGLAAWVRQLSDAHPDDTLLLIHFDADSETWEGFDREMDALTPLIEEGIAVPTTIQAWLDTHPPTFAVDLLGDVADGTGDGFQSWAEKDWNHRLATRLFEARRHLDAAGVLGSDPSDPDWAAASEALLLGLSTTHFGLAAPYLHPDRVASATGFADEATARAAVAVETARAALGPLQPGTVEVVNTRQVSGPALVEFTLEGPAASLDDVSGVALLDASGQEVPLWLGEPTTDGDTTRLPAAAVLSLEARSRQVFTWTATAGGDRATGDVVGLEPLAELGVPFTRCAGVVSEGVPEGQAPVAVDPRAVRAEGGTTWSLGLCGAVGSVQVTQQAWAGLDGVVVTVQATLGLPDDPTDAEEVVLTPLTASAGPQDAVTLAWRTFQGTTRERPIPPWIDTWNGWSVDGWIRLHTPSASLAVAHRVPDRSSLAFAPLRRDGTQVLLAALGTLWGDGPWHDGRRTGGSGVGDVAVSLVGSQFRPAAPDWAGQEVTYRLLVGPAPSEATLELFAHPPLVRVSPL